MIIELMEDYTSRVFFLSCGNTVEEKEKKRTKKENGLYSLKHHPRSISQDETRKS